jgi:hypothetical protein
VRRGISVWLLVLLVAAFAILGNLLGEALSGILPLLGRAVSLGLNPPLVADLNFLHLTFGFGLSLNLAGLIGLLLGAFLYRRWS